MRTNLGEHLRISCRQFTLKSYLGLQVGARLRSSDDPLDPVHDSDPEGDASANSGGFMGRHGEGCKHHGSVDNAFSTDHAQW